MSFTQITMTLFFCDIYCVLEIHIRNNYCLKMSNFVQISFADKQIELDQKIGEIIDAIEKLKSVIPAKQASNSTDSELL